MKLTQKILIAGLCIVSPLLLTHLADRLPWRMDWTSEGLYSLSEPSIEILDTLTAPVELVLYYTPDVENIPARIRNFAKRVKALLKQYEEAAPSRVSVQFLDPAPDTSTEEEAIRAGLSGQRLANGETLYLGLVGKTKEAERTIPFLLPARESALEYDLSRLIIDLSQKNRPKVGVLTSLDLWGEEPDIVRGRAGKSPSILIEELRRIYEVVPVSRRQLPEDLDLLALIHPPGLPDDLAFAIDQYFLAGGPLLIALDPSSVEIRRTQPNRTTNTGLGGPGQSDLANFLKAWEIDYNPRRVVGDFALATTIRLSADDPEIPYPVWLTIRELKEETPATTGLEEILLVEPGSFTVANRDLSVTPILETTVQSGEMMASSVSITPAENIADQISPDGRSELIAALLQGTFPTAFPQGQPGDGKTEQWLLDLQAKDNPWLTKSTDQSRLILVTDSDLFTDRFGSETVRYLSQSTTRRSNDNLALAVNLFELLTGESALTQLRGKGTVTRPFLRVEDLAAEARVAYEKKLDELEEEIRSVREDIRALEATAAETDEEKSLTGEEIEERLRTFQALESQLRQERREIRKELREEIRRLDRTLILLNLLVVPGIIAALALQYFLRRRNPRL